MTREQRDAEDKLRVEARLRAHGLVSMDPSGVPVRLLHQARVPAYEVYERDTYDMRYGDHGLAYGGRSPWWSSYGWPRMLEKHEVRPYSEEHHRRVPPPPPDPLDEAGWAQFNRRCLPRDEKPLWTAPWVVVLVQLHLANWATSTELLAALRAGQADPTWQEALLAAHALAGYQGAQVLALGAAYPDEAP